MSCAVRQAAPRRPSSQKKVGVRVLPDREILLLDASSDQVLALESRLRQRGWNASHRSVGDPGATAALTPAALAVVLAGRDADPTAISPLLARLVRERITTVLWGAAPDPILSQEPLIDALGDDASLDEVVGHVTTLAQYAPLVRRLERELHHLQRLGEQLNHYFEEIDQEMRLAGRLQRDFLPRQFPELPPFRFHALYRPASWVSGDMYDVFRVDERHCGVFIADAMGHGVSAGLLTMFFRNALVPKRVSGEAYQILSPSEVLVGLNATLIRQKLPHCQFITATYTLIDVENRTLRLARGGHPHPLRVGADGAISEVRVEGGLLGVTDIPGDFEESQFALNPGEKLVLYTDGLDEYVLLPRANPSDAPRFTDAFAEWARLPAEEFLAAVERELTDHAGSLHPSDDVTLLVIERASDS